MKRVERVAQMRAFAQAGLTVRQSAEKAGLGVGAVYRAAERLGLQFAAGKRGVFPGQSISNSSRTELMAIQYRGGRTLQQIGDEFGVTRERVRQILAKYAGVSRTEGGKCVRAQRRQIRRLKDVERRAVDLHGCTLAQVKQIREITRRMIGAGKTKYRTPFYAFRGQRNRAAQRAIEWNLSLWDWWKVWEESGKWDQRGRGQGYVMCRYGDVGPYEIGNVFIDLATRNCSHKPSKKRKLPAGVYQRGRRFFAKRMIAGVNLWLGSFESPEQAFKAYLAAVPASSTTEALAS